MNLLLKIWGRIREFFGVCGEPEKEEKKITGEEVEPEYKKQAKKVLNKKIGIPEDHKKYPLLEKYLVMFLSGEDGTEALYRWSELLSSVIGRQVDKKLEEKESELKSKYGENNKMISLDKAMSRAVKSGLLSLSDETAIGILERLRQEPSSLSELKSTMEINEGARWRFDWLRSLNLIEPYLGEGENAIYKATKRGEKMLSRVKDSSSSQKSLESQRHRVAEIAAGENTTAEELLNVLDGNWLEKHRGDLEKIRKEYENPLVEISKAFWLKREGGDPHLKHAGVDIDDHEASGVLLCLELLNIHTRDGKGSKPQDGWNSLFGKKSRNS